MSFTFVIHFSPTTQTRADDNTNCIKLINSFVVDTDGTDNLNTGIDFHKARNLSRLFSYFEKTEMEFT